MTTRTWWEATHNGLPGYWASWSVRPDLWGPGVDAWAPGGYLAYWGRPSDVESLTPNPRMACPGALEAAMAAGEVRVVPCIDGLDWKPKAGA